MTLDLLTQATFAGPAFTEPFVRYELEHELAARKLLPREAGAEGREAAGVLGNLPPLSARAGGPGRRGARAQPRAGAAGGPPGLCPFRAGRRCRHARGPGAGRLL